MANIREFRQLRVYKRGFSAAMQVFEVSKGFPREERFSLTDQIRRSSRSVCACIAEAWRKRAYPRHFISKITDAESEAEETRVWLQFAYACGYLSGEEAQRLDDAFDHVLSQLVLMKNDPSKWSTQTRARPTSSSSPRRRVAPSPYGLGPEGRNGASP